MNELTVKEIMQVANDGDIALDLVKQQLNKSCRCPNRVFKLIVMDLQMPRMNGDKASIEINKIIQEENLRMQRERPNIKMEDLQLTCNIIACSANNTPHWHQLIKDSGMV